MLAGVGVVVAVPLNQGVASTQGWVFNHVGFDVISQHQQGC